MKELKLTLTGLRTHQSPYDMRVPDSMIDADQRTLQSIIEYIIKEEHVSRDVAMTQAIEILKDVKQEEMTLQNNMEGNKMKELKTVIGQIEDDSATECIWEGFDHDDWGEFEVWLKDMHTRGADNLMFWGGEIFVAWSDNCTFDANLGEYAPVGTDEVAPTKDYEEQLQWAKDFFLLA